MKLNVSKETAERLKKELEIARHLNNLRLYKTVKALLLISEGEPAEKHGEAPRCHCQNGFQLVTAIYVGKIFMAGTDAL